MFTSDWVSSFKQARKNIFGILICVFLFLAGFFIHGNTGLYVNLSGFLIIIGGTLGATFLSYNMERIEILFKVLKTSYGRGIKSPNEIVRILVDLSVKKRIKGLLALQDDEDNWRCNSKIFSWVRMGFNYPSEPMRRFCGKREKSF